MPDLAPHTKAESVDLDPLNFGDDAVVHTDRLKVPGGWLYRTFYTVWDGERDQRQIATSTEFVPDGVQG